MKCPFATQRQISCQESKDSECQFNCMCTAARTVSTCALIPDLKRKHKSQKLHPLQRVMMISTGRNK